MAPMFDRALVLRDEGHLEEAAALLEELVASLTRAEPRLLAHTHMQLGYIYAHLNDNDRRQVHFREAAVITPKLELASLGLFHALWALGRTAEALHEMVRFLELRDSDLYRELLCDGYDDGLELDARSLVLRARVLLEQHRHN